MLDSGKIVFLACVVLQSLRASESSGEISLSMSVKRFRFSG